MQKVTDAPMLHDYLNALVPNDAVTLRCVTYSALSGTVAYAFGKRSRSVKVVPDMTVESLADRIKVRLATEPAIVEMSDAQVDRIAALLAPAPQRAGISAAAASLSCRE